MPAGTVQVGAAPVSVNVQVTVVVPVQPPEAALADAAGSAGQARRAKGHGGEQRQARQAGPKHEESPFSDRRRAVDAWQESARSGSRRQT